MNVVLFLTFQVFGTALHAALPGFFRAAPIGDEPEGGGLIAMRRRRIPRLRPRWPDSLSTTMRRNLVCGTMIGPPPSAWDAWPWFSPGPWPPSGLGKGSPTTEGQGPHDRQIYRNPSSKYSRRRRRRQLKGQSSSAY